MHYIKNTLFVAALLVTAGCTGICTRAVKSSGGTADAHVHGIRVYPPRVYLFVSASESKLVTLPDLERAYDIKPWAFFAKHDLKMELGDGVITKVETDQDSTAGLALIQKLAEMGAEAAKGAAHAVEGASFATNFGLDPGIYRLDDQGVFQIVNKKQ
jgi:hypothetical protein